MNLFLSTAKFLPASFDKASILPQKIAATAAPITIPTIKLTFFHIASQLKGRGGGEGICPNTKATTFQPHQANYNIPISTNSHMSLQLAQFAAKDAK